MIQPSNTYKLLYDNIIGELLSQICNSSPDYCVRSRSFPYELYTEFEEFRKEANRHMSSQRLDRHKLASCICGAIIKLQPIAYVNENKDARRVNVIFALYAGLNVIKYYMMFDLIQASHLPIEIQNDAKAYLREHFDMSFPCIDDNICDTQEYRTNLINALYWTNSDCKIINRECLRYDIWAYAKIFYHLELYNKPEIQKAFDSFMTECH